MSTRLFPKGVASPLIIAVALGNQFPTRGEKTVDSFIVCVGGVGKAIGMFVATFHVMKREPLPAGVATTVLGAVKAAWVR